DVATSSDLPPLVGTTKPGTRTELSIWRDGKTMTLPVTVGAQPAEVAGRLGGGDSGSPAAAGNPLGIVVDELTGEQRKQLGIDRDEGVVITRLVGDVARRSALAPGDVILMVG